MTQIQNGDVCLNGISEWLNNKGIKIENFKKLHFSNQFCEI